MKDIKHHERELGGIGSSMTLLLDGQKKLFGCIDDLTKVATRNETNIVNMRKEQDDLSDRIQNGLKDEIARVVVERTAEHLDPAIDSRFQEMDKVMWLPRMIDTSLKKWAVSGLVVAIIGGIIFLIALSSASMWGYFKTTKWGEAPGLMQSIVVDKNMHSHEAPGGGRYMHSHENPDGAAVTSTPKK